MKKFYIYKTTNVKNNKFYIGQHYGELGDKYIGSGSIFKADVKKFGKEHFEKVIIQIYSNAKQLDKAELKFVGVNEVNDKNCYNQILGSKKLGLLYLNNREQYNIIFNALENPLENPITQLIWDETVKIRALSPRVNWQYIRFNVSEKKYLELMQIIKREKNIFVNL